MAKEPKLKKVIISRKRWARGDRPKAKYGTALRTESGQKCCLGFVANQCGVQIKGDCSGFSDLIDKYNEASETAARAQLAKLPEKLRPTVQEPGCPYNDTPLHDELVGVNDDSNLPEHEREAKVRTLLRKAGILVNFVP